MSEYYHSNQFIPPEYYSVDPAAVPNPSYPHGPPLVPPETSFAHQQMPGNPLYHGMPGPFPQFSQHPFPHTYPDQYADIPGPGFESQQGGNARARRRSSGPEHAAGVKHRRTRSGCFTCRQRRVKCDETHPICERCRKGNRECVYPDESNPRPSRSGSKGNLKATKEEFSPEDDYDESHERLPVIADVGEEVDYDMDAKSAIKTDVSREASDTPALTLDRSPTPQDASSIRKRSESRPALSRKSSGLISRAIMPPSTDSTTFPQDVRFYLDYFKNHMSHHHYSLKRDGDNAFKTDLLAMAVKHEPLRYAVVGYAAYFHTLSKPDGQISDFLQYYNESVSRLRASIEKSRKQNLATFLTILQLASIEEMLGDWVNLMWHQKAAYDALTRLYTPESVLQSAFIRKVLLWYIRFDLFVGFQSGGESVLGREWYVSVHDYYVKKVREIPHDLGMKYEERFAYSRLVAKDSNDLFARKARGLLTDEKFMEELPKLADRINNLDKNIDPVLLDPSEHVTDLAGDPDPDDIVNPYETNIIWGGSRWTTNYLIMDMYGIILMFQIQISHALRKPFDPDLKHKALRVAQVFEAICLCPKATPGAIIEAQASLAIATLFLPKDPKTIQWCRRTFVKIESAGYIYSSTLRNRMLEQWGLAHSDWWFPNDENCPPIIRSIKDFIQERTMAPKDQTSEDLREMKGIFSTLTISDSPADDNMGNSPPIEGVLASGAVPATMDDT
ncbi:uncharacterized protein EI97DRAFT_378796 [Westerdykella ornata]|uniref:Zn(2)-C6 fungal-type domain-containing protein n=1 Tax=Westerdykella ornata TaxID=318751 RepID=A0A6A6JG91_WESOR|nr:uncharacterized protein EI97DRAFT_378796 [Westerdykella ornata]KAF2275660.1 hypothetical protein EI97DRAFT_378796 [Westerdykella ornata]